MVDLGDVDYDIHPFSHCIRVVSSIAIALVLLAAEEATKCIVVQVTIGSGHHIPCATSSQDC